MRSTFVLCPVCNEDIGRQWHNGPDPDERGDFEATKIHAAKNHREHSPSCFDDPRMPKNPNDLPTE